ASTTNPRPRVLYQATGSLFYFRTPDAPLVVSPLPSEAGDTIFISGYAFNLLNLRVSATRQTRPSIAAYLSLLILPIAPQNSCSNYPAEQICAVYASSNGDVHP